MQRALPDAWRAALKGFAVNDALPPDATDDRVRASRHNLERIADVLGCPVEAFFLAEGLPRDLSGGIELLDLWGRLKTDATRLAVLKLVRAVVEAEGG